ncbi:MAG: hypothetical protein Q8N39_03720 [Pelolinea sp.]|nr:hypothetical protein [Pelolinea sp.]
MKPINEMSQAELAAFIQSHLESKNIKVALSGGAVVAFYSKNQYVSKDLDLVNMYSAKRAIIRDAMAGIGFIELDRHFHHPDSEFFVEFPPGPLSLGSEHAGKLNQIHLTTGVLHLLNPTDCVKDRLAAYYHWGDRQCLAQAILVSKAHMIDIKEVERWSVVEGKGDEFHQIKDKLQGKDKK